MSLSVSPYCLAHARENAFGFRIPPSSVASPELNSVERREIGTPGTIDALRRADIVRHRPHRGDLRVRRERRRKLIEPGVDHEGPFVQQCDQVAASCLRPQRLAGRTILGVLVNDFDVDWGDRTDTPEVRRDRSRPVGDSNYFPWAAGVPRNASTPSRVAKRERWQARTTETNPPETRNASIMLGQLRSGSRRRGREKRLRASDPFRPDSRGTKSDRRGLFRQTSVVLRQFQMTKSSQQGPVGLCFVLESLGQSVRERF